MLILRSASMGCDAFQPPHPAKPWPVASLMSESKGQPDSHRRGCVKLADAPQAALPSIDFDTRSDLARSVPAERGLPVRVAADLLPEDIHFSMLFRARLSREGQHRIAWRNGMRVLSLPDGDCTEDEGGDDAPVGRATEAAQAEGPWEEFDEEELSEAETLSSEPSEAASVRSHSTPGTAVIRNGSNAACKPLSAGPCGTSSTAAPSAEVWSSGGHSRSSSRRS